MLRLNLLRLLQQNAADYGACKQARLAAPGSGGQKSEIRVPAQLDRGSPGPQVSRRSSQGRRACSLTALIPFRRNPPSRPDRPPKAPPPHSITWELRLSAGESGQGHAQTAAGSVQGRVRGHRAGCAQSALSAAVRLPRPLPLQGASSFVDRLSGKQ